MKKIVKLLIALCLVLTLLPAALAESYELVFERESMSTLSEPADAVIAYSYDSRCYSLVGLDGQEILPSQYNRITNSGCVKGYYIATSGEEINCAQLFDQTGKAVTAELYGDILMLSDKWALGVKLVLAEGEEYDYWAFGSDDKYNIAAVDVYYLPAAGKAGTLTRAEYMSADAFGDYLRVRAREGGVQLYNARMEKVESAFTATYEDEYYVTDKGLTRNVLLSRITGETIAQGYEDVEGVYAGRFIAVSTEEGTGLIDNTGAVLLPCEYDDVEDSSNPRYLAVEKDDKYGLYDLETLQLILPCEYENILDHDYETLCYNGYFIVVQDGLFGYANETGVTVQPQYDEAEVILLGCSAVVEGEEGFTLIAADGVVTPLTGIKDVREDDNLSRGKYIVVQNEQGDWGVVDWHGSVIVEPCMSSPYDFEFASAQHMIVDDDYLYIIK